MPPIFRALNADAAVRALLGAEPLRAWAFGLAPQDVVKPYLVWQRAGGQPENYINQRPDSDSATLQIDVYAETGDQAREVAEAARYAIEGWAHVIADRGESRDPSTMNYRSSFDTDWIVNR